MTIDGWQQTLTTWGPRVYAAVVVLLFAVLLLNGKRGEAGLFALCAGGVAWLLFTDGAADLRYLPERIIGASVTTGLLTAGCGRQSAGDNGYRHRPTTTRSEQHE